MKGEEEAWTAQVRDGKREHKVVEWGQKVKWLGRRVEKERRESLGEIHGEVRQVREERWKLGYQTRGVGVFKR